MPGLKPGIFVFITIYAHYIVTLTQSFFAREKKRPYICIA
jgi:hypothetical protein